MELRILTRKIRQLQRMISEMAKRINPTAQSSIPVSSNRNSPSVKKQMKNVFLFFYSTICSIKEVHKETNLPHGIGSVTFPPHC